MIGPMSNDSEPEYGFEASGQPGLAHILKLPTETLQLIAEECHEEGGGYHHLVSVCQRLRHALIPHLYRNISIPQLNDAVHPGLPALLECLDTHGHGTHTRILQLWIQRTPSEEIADDIGVLTSLARCVTRKRLPNLRHFNLQLYPNGGQEHPDPLIITRPLLPESDPLSQSEIATLAEIFAGLPSGLESLDVSGFRWTNCMEALNARGVGGDGARVVFPHLRRFAWDLHLDLVEQPTMASAGFLRRTVPHLADVTFPAELCPDRAWVEYAFPSEREVELTHLTIGVEDAHGCSESECNRAWTLAYLFRLASPSSSPHSSPSPPSAGTPRPSPSPTSTLTHLTLSTFSFSSLPLAQYCISLESLTLRGLNFRTQAPRDNAVLLEDLVGAFMTLPRLATMRVVECAHVPEVLARWFRLPMPGPGPPFLPNLKYLEITSGCETEWDAGDFPDSDALASASASYPSTPSSSDWDWNAGSLAGRGHPHEWYWRPATRRRFEEDCLRRGIEAVVEWDWNEDQELPVWFGEEVEVEVEVGEGEGEEEVEGEVGDEEE